MKSGFIFTLYQFLYKLIFCEWEQLQKDVGLKLIL